MSVETIALKFKELVNQGKHFEVMRTMYAPEMVSVEADGKEYVGKDVVIHKSEVFQGNNDILSQDVRELAEVATLRVQESAVEDETISLLGTRPAGSGVVGVLAPLPVMQMDPVARLYRIMGEMSQHREMRQARVGQRSALVGARRLDLLLIRS